MGALYLIPILAGAAFAAEPEPQPERHFSAGVAVMDETLGARGFRARGGADGVLTSFTASQAPSGAAAAARSVIVILAIVDGPPAFALPVRLPPASADGEEKVWDLMPKLSEGAAQGKFSLKPVPGANIQVQFLTRGGEFVGPPLSALWAYPGMPVPEEAPRRSVTRVKRVTEGSRTREEVLEPEDETTWAE